MKTTYPQLAAICVAALVSFSANQDPAHAVADPFETTRWTVESYSVDGAAVELPSHQMLDGSVGER